MDYKKILKVLPTIEAVKLADANIKLANKKKISGHDALKQSATNIVGVNLIKLESDFINS